MSEAERPSNSADSDAVKVDFGGAELLQDLQPLWEALFAHQFLGEAAGLPVQQQHDSWPLRLAHYERIFDRQPAFVILARQGKKAVGYALAYADEPIEGAGDGPVVTIESLIVAPEMRGQGLGGWLLEEAEAEGIDQWGAEVSALEVPANDPAAAEFYGRFGFVERGETWMRPAQQGEAVGTQHIDDDRLGDLLDEGSELFALGLEEGPDNIWQSSEVLTLCQPEPGYPADPAALEDVLAPFAEAGASSVLVALDDSSDSNWGEALTSLGFHRVLRLVTRPLVID